MKLDIPNPGPYLRHSDDVHIRLDFLSILRLLREEWLHVNAWYLQLIATEIVAANIHTLGHRIDTRAAWPTFDRTDQEDADVDRLHGRRSG